MLRLDFNLVLEMINLLVLFLLLRKFLIRPITGIMEKREAMIADGIKTAQNEQEKALELKKRYEKSLNGAKEESKKLIEQAKLDAKNEYDRIVSDADDKSGRMLQTARDAIHAEREQTMRSMKLEVAGLAMDAAKKIAAGQDGRSDSQAAYDLFLEEAGDGHEDSQS